MRYSGLRAHLGPVCALILLPVSVSLAFVLHWADNNPAGVWSGLATRTAAPLLAGAPGYFDPSIGLLTQPLAKLSAWDWLHGIIPWWNPYTGIGMPLAAEMQTLSFFMPFVLIMNDWQGWFAVKLLMQIIAGFGTYALMIQIGCRRTESLVSAGLFALNGAFLMEPQAMGALAFLPLILLGIERSAAAARFGAAQGWHWIVFGLAYSLYGGFPEVAYLDGLLAALWTCTRFASLGAARWRFAGKIILAVTLGLSLTLPVLVPFLHYIAHSTLALHRRFYQHSAETRPMTPLALFPLIYGVPGTGRPSGLASYPNLAAQWTQLGGWVGLTAVIPALAALTSLKSTPHRGLVIALGLFVAIGLARCFGVPWVSGGLNAVVPALAQIDAARFLWPPLSMAIFVLTGIGLGQAGRSNRRTALLWLGIVIAWVLAVIVPNHALIAAWYQHVDRKISGLILLSTGFEGVASVMILIMLTRPTSRARQRGLAGLILLDAMMVAAVPQLAAPLHNRFHRGGIHFLQTHLGDARFYSLGPFGPDYPAGYRLASIDDNQLPVSRGWSHYIAHKLNRRDSGMMFVGWWNQPDGGDGQVALRQNLADYQAIGVKYVITGPGTDLSRSTLILPARTTPAGGVALGVGQSFHAALPNAEIGRLRALAAPIDRLTVLIGTFDGHARGNLAATLCAGPICASGSAALDHASDDAPLPIRLTPPLPIAAHQPITVQLTHQQGRGAVEIWLRRTAHHATIPRLTLSTERAHPPFQLVYQDRVMAIYRLATYRRLFTASPACQLTSHGLNQLDADCRTQATLTRLEAWFPGWHAKINGHPSPIQRDQSVFQSLRLPQGRSLVQFSYRPRDTRRSVALACLGLFLWISCALGLPRKIRGAAAGFRA